MGAASDLRTAGVSRRRARAYREPRHAGGAGWAFDGRCGRAVGRGDASGIARLVDHRRCAAWTAADSPPADVAMAAQVARRPASRASYRGGHNQEVSLPAARDKIDAPRDRAACSPWRRAVTDRRMGVSLRSGNPRMAKAWGADVEAESQKDQDADAIAARRSERAGEPGAREADASEDSRIGAERDPALVSSCAAGQSRRHRGGDYRVRGK